MLEFFKGFKPELVSDSAVKTVQELVRKKTEEVVDVAKYTMGTISDDGDSPTRSDYNAVEEDDDTHRL